MPRKVLILRSANKSRNLAKFLRKRNCQIFQLATHKIIQGFSKDLDKNSDLATFDGVILTSANAAHSLANLRLDQKIKIFAVGKKTAEAASFLGFDNCEFPKQACASNLALLIKKSFQEKSCYENFQAKKLLYLRGSKISFDLRRELESETISITELVVYHQSQNRNFSSQLSAILRKTTIDEILIFSQESLNLLSKSIKRPYFSSLFGKLQLVCISNKIATKAKKNGFKNTKIFAQKPFLKKFYELNSLRSSSLQNFETD